MLLDEGERLIAASKAIDHWRPGIAREDAEELLAALVDPDGPEDVELDLEEPVAAASARRYREWIRRRARGEPVPLITGFMRFGDLRLRTRPGVFVPRGSSELLAESALAAVRRRRAPVVVDVATGAGPVALSVADAMPAAEVWGVDIAADAVALARGNARRLGLGNARFRVSDMLDRLPAELLGRVDVFTIHPPYVRRDEVSLLPKEIRRFEPRHVLTDGSDDGLGLVRRLIADAPRWLAPHGSLIIEVAPYLSRSVQALLRRAGYGVRWTADPDGVTRVIIGTR